MTLAELRLRIKELDADGKREFARKLVVNFCSEKVERVIDGQTLKCARTIQQVRGHFDSRTMEKFAAELGVDWQPLIDAIIRTKTVHVTNGFVIVRMNA